MSCFDAADAIAIEPAPGWVGRAVHGDQMTLVDYRISEGAPDVHEHHHPEEEAWTVIDGELKVWIEGEAHTLTTGEAIVIAPNAHHRVQAIRTTHAIVVDSPARHHLPGTSHQPS
jgi:quercetin dioxygenase-like cupin family protein